MDDYGEYFTEPSGKKIQRIHCQNWSAVYDKVRVFATGVNQSHPYYSLAGSCLLTLSASQKAWPWQRPKRSCGKMCCRRHTPTWRGWGCTASTPSDETTGSRTNVQHQKNYISEPAFEFFERFLPRLAHRQSSTEPFFSCTQHLHHDFSPWTISTSVMITYVSIRRCSENNALCQS